MYLKKFKANQLTKERLKSIKAGFRDDCGVGEFSCEISGPGYGTLCLPHGCECALWAI